MAQRKTLSQDHQIAHTACGCSGPLEIEPRNCRYITCKKCPERVRVEKGGEERFCIDFSTCGHCEDGECGDEKKYFLLGLPKSENKNLMNCVDSSGDINLKALNMDQMTGKLWLTVDAFDPRLNNGEIRRFKWWFRAPDMTRRSLTFDVCVGPK